MGYFVARSGIERLLQACESLDARSQRKARIQRAANLTLKRLASI
jgi:hypothetical protein